MITQTTFTDYLTSVPKLQPLTFSHIGKQGEHIKQWVLSLPMHPQAEQIKQIEKTLSELILIEMADAKRLSLMEDMVLAVERLAAQLHHDYTHEIGQLNHAHLASMAQVKSLYFMCVLVYNGVVTRDLAKRLPQGGNKSSVWKRLLPMAKAMPSNLAVAIYWLMVFYHKLLLEFAISYQKSPNLVWQQLNHLYLLAATEDVADIDLSKQTMVKNSNSIHDVYCQICLHSLLNLVTYKRQDIIGMMRLLPSWASHLTATLQPQSKTRIFVNLHGDTPPEYLTPYSSINPYDEHYTCLFIELTELLTYLNSREQTTQGSQGETLFERRLVQKALLTLQHQYFNRRQRSVPRHEIEGAATLVTGFNRIHYHIAGKSSLANLIRQKELIKAYCPKYNTAPPLGKKYPTIMVELMDKSDVGYRFCYSRKNSSELDSSELTNGSLNNPASSNSSTSGSSTSGSSTSGSSTSSYAINSHATNNKNDKEHSSNPQDNEPANSLTANEVIADEANLATTIAGLNNLAAPPALQVMSLFAINCEDENLTKNWQLGVTRWIDVTDEQVQVGGELVGLSATACGIRLENNDGREQDFVAALLIAGNEVLNTKSSLMFVRYHFKEGDRVVLRIQDKQTVLTLQKNILRTDEVEQYEVAKLTH